MSEPHPSPEFDNGAGCLTRLYWMFAGNALAVILLGLLLRDRTEFPSLPDAGYLLTLASLVAVRYVDIRHLKGRTGDDHAPATLGDWRKYAALTAGAGLGAWAAVRLLILLLAR